MHRKYPALIVTASAAAAFMLVPTSAGAVSATQHESIAWKDASVSKTSPYTTDGSSHAATVTSSDRSLYAAFNTDLPHGAVATRAELHLTPLTTAATHIDVRAVPGDVYGWSESDITWSKQPALSTPVVARSATSAVAGRTLVITLPVSVLQAGDTDLRINTRKSSTSIATDEHGTAAYRPRLVVTFSAAPGPVDTTSPSPSPAPEAPTPSPSAAPVAPAPAPSASHVVTGIARYVAVTGDDVGGDGSSARPWRTWSRGLAGLRALGGGHTLVLRGGVYTERFDSASNTPRGTPSARVRVTSQPGETVVIRGLTRFYEPDYLTVDHLVFESASGDDPTQHTFRMVNGVGWTVEDNEFRNLRSFAGLHVTSWQDAGRPAAAVVRHNVFRDQRDARPAVANNTQHFIYAGVGATGGLTITRNEFLRGANTGGAVKIGPNSLGAVDISYNTFAQNAPYTLLFEDVVDKVRVHRNILGGGGSSQLQLWNYRGSGTLLTENVWWGAPLLTDETLAKGASDELTGAGNVQLDPPLADPTNGDLRPLDAAAAGYGRHAGVTDE